MGAYEDLTAAWDEWQTATLYKTWAKHNPGELAKLTIYRAGGPKPILATATGRALVDETSAWLATAPVDPPDPPDPPTPGVPRPTLQNHLTSGYFASQDGADANYQVIWGSKNNDYSVDRLVNDNFQGAMLWKPKSPWPNRPAAGNWGRFWNFHNTPGDNPQGYGWSLPPGNSAFAFDFYDGTIWLNLDANGINGPKDFVIKSNTPLDHRYTIATKVVWGRTDGGTARKGSVKVWLDGQLVLDNPACNTMWKWANGAVQHQMVVWAGHYTQDIKPGITLNWEHAQPWMGVDWPSALQSPASPGCWAISDIPIPGKDHSDGPATCKNITSWTSADLVLPAGWA